MCVRHVHACGRRGGFAGWVWEIGAARCGSWFSSFDAGFVDADYYLVTAHYSSDVAVAT